MTTVANGLCTSAPMPVLSAMGTNPRPATSAVMATGLSRASAPSRAASPGDRPFALSWLKNATRTTPFKTAMPMRAMNPMEAETLKGMPLMAREKIPPVMASGMVV